MGMTLSCPFTTADDLNTRCESLSTGSLSFGSDDVKAEYRSVSFNGRESEPVKFESFGSRKKIVEGSLSFKGRESDNNISLKAPLLNKGAMVSRESKGVPDKLPSPGKLSRKNSAQLVKESGNQRHHAAVKLQKTYKSFRTRRQLADCAVLVEQRWWKLLDFAELKRSSVSFFDIEKPETAVSRWSRARKRAAKVGKGLSKDEKARKLAFQHWLEAIDPRHRYGHNLQFYYAKWLQCESRQPFFYWLDVGEGKEVNLEKCSRSNLQQQCIKYLGPMERQEFEVKIENGKFFYNQSGMLLDTKGGPEDAKWIFVLSVSKILYVGQKKKGTFQHSSFLAGGATLSAGRLVVENGILKAVWPHSGHYLPTEENFEEFLSFLEQHKVDVSVVQKSPSGEDEEVFLRKESNFLRNSISEPNFSRINQGRDSREKIDSYSNYSNDVENSCPPSSRRPRMLQSKIASIKIPKRENMSEVFKNEKQPPSPSCSTKSAESPSDGYETAEEYLSDTELSVPKQNLFDDDQEEEYEEPIPKEKILKRIFSHKGMKSYQLAQQLSCKWTTGAGPRIGCVRDYPPELQFRALEEVCLSPRSAYLSPRKYARPSSKLPTPNNVCRETSVGRSPLASETVMFS